MILTLKLTRFFKRNCWRIAQLILRCYLLTGNGAWQEKMCWWLCDELFMLIFVLENEFDGKFWESPQDILISHNKVFSALILFHFFLKIVSNFMINVISNHGILKFNERTRGVGQIKMKWSKFRNMLSVMQIFKYSRCYWQLADSR